MTNLCQSCRLVPAIPGIRWCFFCAEDASAEFAAANDRPQYTGDICHWCGDNLTVADTHSSSPSVCVKCRRQADRDEFNGSASKRADATANPRSNGASVAGCSPAHSQPSHLPHSLAEWLKDADAKQILQEIT